MGVFKKAANVLEVKNEGRPPPIASNKCLHESKGLPLVLPPASELPREVREVSEKALRSTKLSTRLRTSSPSEMLPIVLSKDA
jgi:hypothetical protein